MMGDMLQDEGHDGLTPIGVLDGQFIWPIFGAEDDDPDDVPGGDPDDEDDEDEDDEPESKSKKGNKKSKSKASDKDEEDDDEDDDESDDEDVSYWRGKAQTYKRRMEAADRRATEAERENRRLKQSDKDRLDEPGKQDLKDAKDAAAAAAKVADSLRLQVALLSDTTYQWHDPALVIKALQDDDAVEIDEETGKVLGVQRALKRLARQKPYLLKTESAPKGADDEDDEEDDEVDETPPTPRRRSTTQSGAQVGTRKKRQQVDRAKVIQKYPILNRR